MMEEFLLLRKLEKILHSLFDGGLRGKVAGLAQCALRE